MADNDTYDPRDALIALLRDCLDGEEFDAAVGLLDEVMANPGAQAADRKRKMTTDSFAWIMREGRRLEKKSHIEAENKRLAPLPAVMAMDGKELNTMVDRETIKAWQAVQAAERETGIVGKSSADETYAAALRQMGMDASGLVGHANAAKAAFTALKNKPRARAAMAADAKTIAARTERFPHADRLHKGFYVTAQVTAVTWAVTRAVWVRPPSRSIPPHASRSSG